MKKYFYKKDSNEKNDTINKENIFFQNKDIVKKLKQKKSKKYKRLFLILKIVAVVLILFLGFTAFSFFGKFNRKLNLSDIGLNETDEAAERQICDITNILLLGIDDNNVSDSMIITSIDKAHKKIKLISIARDSLVEIENPKTKKTYRSKINEAYSNGAEATTLKTLNKNFGLRLMDYITINFEGLVSVIDKLDGVDLEISKQESLDIDGIINTTKSLKRKHSQMLRGQHGTVHLNGSQAVAYARIRKTPTLTGLNDDFGRAYRQRQLLNIVFNKVMNIDKTKVPGLITTFLPYMKTSLDFKTIFNIYSCVKHDKYDIDETQIPIPAYTIDPDYEYNGKSTVFYDVDYAGKIINELIYNDIAQQSYIENNPPKVHKINSKNSHTTSKYINSERSSNSNSKYSNNSNSKYSNNSNSKYSKNYTKNESNQNKKYNNRFNDYKQTKNNDKFNSNDKQFIKDISKNINAKSNQYKNQNANNKQSVNNNDNNANSKYGTSINHNDNISPNRDNSTNSNNNVSTNSNDNISTNHNSNINTNHNNNINTSHNANHNDPANKSTSNNTSNNSNNKPSVVSINATVKPSVNNAHNNTPGTSTNTVPNSSTPSNSAASKPNSTQPSVNNTVNTTNVSIQS